MILADLSKAELEALLVKSVDAWHPDISGKPNPLEIFHHWRGRPTDSTNCMITMLECARVAWRRSQHSADAFDDLLLQAKRLLEVDTFQGKINGSYLEGSFELAKALTHVCMAAGYWSESAKHQNAVHHLSQAAELYHYCWPLGLEPYVDFSPFDAYATALPNLYDAPNSIMALLYGTFGPTKLGHSIPVAGTTYMILYELLSYIMNSGRQGSKTEMQGLFVGPDRRDPEHEIGHVLAITVRRLPAPVQSFFLDPVTLGVTLIDKPMRDSLRVAWRCCLFDPPKASDTKPFSLRVEVSLADPRVGLLRGGSAGGLLAAMMCAARDRIELSTNLSATCTLKLTKSERECSDSTPLDPHRVKLGPILGTVPKLREAWMSRHVDEVYLHEKNYEEWERSRHSNPIANKVANLAELLICLNRDQPLWQELEKASGRSHARWNEIIRHQDKPRGGPDQHHRLDLYVSPLLRLEGEPCAYDEESAKLMASQSLIVPGNELSDQPLENVLALAFGGTADIDWELWPTANSNDDAAEVNDEDARRSSHSTAPGWLGAGRDLLIYDTAGAGKSVLTLRIERLLSDSQRWQRIFQTTQPTLVVRIEGMWPVRNGQLLPLREMIFETILKQYEHPNSTETRYLREEDKVKLRKGIDFAFTKRRLVLVVDGFDQFASEAREHIVAEHDTDDGRDCRWIVASRQHTIATLFGSSRRSRDWMRVRIEPFGKKQRDEFFRLAGLADVWQKYVNPKSEAMAEMLRLPVVLDQVREFIENRIAAAKQSGRPPEPVEFESLSQLALVTSRLSLERALDPKKLADLKPPEHLKLHPKVQLDAVEQVLSLVAFEQLLQARDESGDAWNGLVRGRERKELFLEQCRDRYHRPIDLELWQLVRKPIPEIGDSRKIDDLKALSAKDRETWNWSMSVLERIELNHRTYMEQNGEDVLAFRDRKAVEFYAARYLTRYATKWDIFADYHADKRTMEPTDALCAWQRIADPQWSNTWRLAIDMPQQPLPGTTEHTFTGAVLDPWASCLSLSALFRPTLDKNRRPTELLWRCWPLFECDPHRALDGRYRLSGKLVTGDELIANGLDKDLQALATRQLLIDRDDSNRVRDARENCLAMFRESSRQLVMEIEARIDKVLLNDGTRRSIPFDTQTRETILSQWKDQSAREKSLTFLQCPPQGWIDSYESDPNTHDDPRINPAIKGQEKKLMWPLLVQATAVTREMFYEFDPHFDKLEAIAESLKHETWQNFPMVDANWFDAFMFCKWMGSNYRLPNEFEWELAARAGTRTDYHFGERLSGDLANCDGSYPYPRDAKHPSKNYLEGCSPVGLNRYPCSPWGLWDVHGNVWEWCQDWSSEMGLSRVLRGGSWLNSGESCRSGYRSRNDPANRRRYCGFRLAAVLVSQAGQTPGT